MEKNHNFESVQMWEEDINIPTYETGKPNINPMFVEKRVYQGSSGKIYPFPVIDKVYDNKIEKKYRVVFLENKFLKIMLIPALGGRIQMAYDKTNDYHFVYYNKVIKPALIGIFGPWISGGVEFNWPLHHRPTSFGPLDYTLDFHNNGKKTVWISEIDKFSRMKGMIGFSLYPDKAYLEMTIKLYNRTPISQSFLWWANAAVHANDNYQFIFPPDVNYVFDHGRRDVSEFPIATDIYYKWDYSSGVDISYYKNIPVPTSYMVEESNFDFLGGYDHKKRAGILLVADHYTSPGKKLFTWGRYDFGEAWEKELTDDDGPYVELMLGAFSNNQPDFSWLEPYEEKSFTHYLLPFKSIGGIKNANQNIALNLTKINNEIMLGIYSSVQYRNLDVVVSYRDKIIYRAKINVDPYHIFYEKILDSDAIDSSILSVLISSKDGEYLLKYESINEENKKIKEPAREVLQPLYITTNEQLYLTGLHLEQYKHGTVDAEPYYREALKRDPNDTRNNTALGLLLYKRGEYSEAEKCFRNAIKILTQKNPNPYHGEAYYYLGLVLQMKEKYEEAYNAFYKSIWNGTLQDCGYFAIAQIESLNKNFKKALEFVNKSLCRNIKNNKARNLKATLLRKLLEHNSAITLVQEILNDDKLDFYALNEYYILLKETLKESDAINVLNDLIKKMRNALDNYIEISLDYASCGFYEEAIEFLLRLTCHKKDFNPLIYYYLGYYELKRKNKNQSLKYFDKASKIKPDYCFPSRLESISVLNKAILENPDDSKAYYYLGNLWYDKKGYKKAIRLWEKSITLDSNFPTVHRNLAIAYFNIVKDGDKAKKELEYAFELNQKDARILFELDLLYKKLNYTSEKRLETLEKHEDIVKERDDLYLELIKIYNSLGNFEKARQLLLTHRFHPWEAGEGNVGEQFIISQIGIARGYIKENEYEKAINALKETEKFPENLGEGKILGIKYSNVLYYLGLCYQELVDNAKANYYYKEASEGRIELEEAKFYNDQSPEMVFYQGLALSKLGLIDSSNSRFNQLINYGENQINKDPTIYFFALQIPELDIYNEDLKLRNEIHSRFLIALGNLGLNNYSIAEKEFNMILYLDSNHQLTMLYKNWISNLIKKG